jgi:hypothetical protein
VPARWPSRRFRAGIAFIAKALNEMPDKPAAEPASWDTPATRHESGARRQKDAWLSKRAGARRKPHRRHLPARKREAPLIRPPSPRHRCRGPSTNARRSDRRSLSANRELPKPCARPDFGHRVHTGEAQGPGAENSPPNSTCRVAAPVPRHAGGIPLTTILPSPKR